MAGKKHGKKKRFQQVNRTNVQNVQTDLNQPNNSTATIPTAAQSIKPAPSVKTAPSGKISSAVSKVVSFEYFTSDLKRIGILMAVIVVVLIVLGLVLK
jgi:hypothetical protein